MRWLKIVVGIGVRFAAEEAEVKCIRPIGVNGVLLRSHAVHLNIQNPVCVWPS